jgi:histidinol-phosphatase
MLLWRLADEADTLSLPVWRAGDPEVTIKQDGSPVTATDRAVETRLQAIIAATNPDDGFLGEEVGLHPGRSDRCWIVDGIDGTSLFVGGRPEWSTLIGLAVGPRIVAGMVTSPALGRRWYTSPDGGPLTAPSGDGGGPRSPRPLRVTDLDDPTSARIATWPPDPETRPAFADRVGPLRRLLAGRTPFERPIDRAVPHSAILVADGRADAYITLGGQPWDHAAAVALVTDAGGRFTDLDGRDSIEGGAGFYSNGPLHGHLIDALTP